MQSEDSTFVDVILPLATGSTFTYSLPKELVSKVFIGSRVIVQFGKRKVYSAIVKNIHHNKPLHYQTKDVLSSLDEFPIVNKIQLQFWDWMSDYYMCSLGEVYKAALPSGLKLESESKIVANPQFTEKDILSENELLVFNIIESRKSLTIDEIATQSEIKNILNIINILVSLRAIFIREVVSEKYTPKMELYIDAGGDITDSDFVNGVFESLSKAKKQQELFLQFIQLCFERNKNPEKELISKKNLLAKPTASIAALKGLVEKGILVEVEKEIGRLKPGDFNIKSLKELNPYQREALDSIQDFFVEKDVVLLRGVTASGKTEVYIHLIAQAIAEGKQVLYLLPEIALTAQIINRLTSVFGNQVGVYHSKFNDSERVEVWNNVLLSNDEKTYKIILGVRSSVFLPFKNIGLVIIDEEHETSYKQFDPSPRYNGRDSGVMLARLHGAKVLMGTATPAVETFFNAKSGKYGLVELTQRHTNVALPQITIVDIKDETRRKRMHSHFTATLLDKMKLALDKGEQVILFQNRRGFSPYVECHDCGTIPQCIHCDVSLTFHRHSNNLICHYCGYQLPNNSKCVACGSPKMETRGFGTEKIEDEIAIFFPDKKIERMDLDTTRAKHAYSEIIARFEAREIDILVGTQMITKGLDFDNVSLVGILNADNMLNQPDFRAFERSYQLMTQVAGRAGRNKDQGEVVIQTSNPTHQILNDVRESDFTRMIDSQLIERQHYGYPPYTRLIRLTVRHKDLQTVENASKILATFLRSHMEKQVLGPEFPPISKIQNLYLKNILLKIDKSQNLVSSKFFLSNCITHLHSQEQYKSVDVVINIDPY
jgi:primosomal protein N' (replication factor Y) (superfamily II helicase)